VHPFIGCRLIRLETLPAARGKTVREKTAEAVLQSEPPGENNRGGGKSRGRQKKTEEKKAMSAQYLESDKDRTAREAWTISYRQKEREKSHVTKMSKCRASGTGDLQECKNEKKLYRTVELKKRHLKEP